MSEESKQLSALAKVKAQYVEMYDFDEVKRRVSITQYLINQGYKFRDGRTQAKWRDGDGFNVAINDAMGTWCDHGGGGNNEGGSVIDLCMKIEGVASATEAANVLGARYGVPSKDATKRNGAKEVTHYDYTDENGKPLYCVVRYEPKDFRQFAYDDSGKRLNKLGKVRRVLYNLPQVIETANKGGIVFVVEGEKDANSLNALGLTATTTSGGASGGGKWSAKYSNTLKGASKVVIIADNDRGRGQEAGTGEHHALTIKTSLDDCGVDCVVSYVREGKDATDWIEHGAKKEDFLKLADDPVELQEDTSFSNYTEVSVKNKTITTAKSIGNVRADLLRRTNDWPRLIGSTLFVHQPKATNGNQRYYMITKPPALFAWIRETITPRWKNANGGAQDSGGVNFVTMEQLYQSLHANATHYEGISRAPHYPLRPDQFYDYGELPPPSGGHRAFWQLIDFFCLANDTYRLLAAAFFCSPMFYKTSTDDNAIPTPMPRPVWLIDTEDGQGSGKSTLAKMVALLYGSAVLDVNMSQLTREPDQVLKRILSVEGRQKRVFLIDNATGTIKDGTLAAWVTAATISGRAPYGHGDETRANDFTWCITVNSAEIDTDTATRAYTIKVRKRDTEFKTNALDNFGHPLKWEATVTRYITENRLQLFSDIIDMLGNAKPRESGSRFPDFDACVLSAICQSDAEFDACRASIEADANGANIDANLAEEFTEAVETYLAQNAVDVVSDFNPTALTMLTHKVVQRIIESSNGKLHDQTVKQLRTLLKSGLAPKFSRKNPRLNSHGDQPHPETITYGLHNIPDGAMTMAFQLLDLVPFQGVANLRIIRNGEIKTATLI